MAYHLKTRIAIAVSLLTLAFTLLISWVAHLYFEKEFKTTAFKFIADSLEVTGANLSTKAHQSLHALELIRNSIPIEIMNDRDAMQAFLDHLDTERIIFDSGISIFSPDGVMQAITPYQDDVIGVDFSFRNYIKYTLLHRQPYISAPLDSRPKYKDPTIMLTEPIYNEEDEITGILAGRLNPYSSNFLDILINNKIGENGFYMVLDQREIVLVHPNRAESLTPADYYFPREQVADFLEKNNGLVQKATVNGMEMIGAYQHISPLNWILVALSPLEESHAPILKARWYTAIALSVMLFLIILAVRVLTNRLTSPLTDLTGEVRLLAEQEDTELKLKMDQYKELGDLSQSIQLLVTRLANKRKGISDQLVFLQNLIDTIPGPIFYKDADFRYLGCNKAFEEFLGVPKEDLIGKSPFEIAPPELAKVYYQADKELWDQGGQQIYETSVKYADGSNRNVIFHKNIFRDADGNAVGLIGTFLDITDRKQGEEILRNTLEEAQTAKEQVDNILRSAADGIIVTDRRNRVTHINQIAEEMLGVQADSVTGRAFTRLFVNKELRDQARSFLSGDGLGPHHIDFKLNLSGVEFPRIVQALSSVLSDADGKRSGMVTLLRDVTRERELDQIKNEFISTAAHEMRTPMSVIMGYLEILLDVEEFGEFSREKREEFLREAYRKSEVLAQIIDDLFDISRIEAGLPLPIDKTECNISDLLTTVVEHFRKHTSNHVFSCDLDPQAKVIADINKMTQVFENLLSNAIKYSPDGGEITIRSRNHGEYLQISIEDSGLGMSDEQIERIFDKFYRADSSNTAISGLGLGMSIVKAIIERHGGRIWVKSTKGEGTCVYLDLPRNQDSSH